MRKIAAHYYLRPNNTIGKFPVVSFNEDGVISEIRERDSFSEEPFMEHVNGLLFPAFISSLSAEDCQKDEKDLTSMLKRILINGNKLILVPETYLNTIQSFAPVALVVRSSNYKNNLLMNNELLDQESLPDAFQELVYKLDNVKGFGKLEVGTAPGILALSGVGNAPFCLVPKSKIKRII